MRFRGLRAALWTFFWRPAPDRASRCRCPSASHPPAPAGAGPRHGARHVARDGRGPGAKPRWPGGAGGGCGQGATGNEAPCISLHEAPSLRPCRMHRMLILGPRRHGLMSVTRREPAQGGGRGQADEKGQCDAVPFDVFLKLCHMDALASRDAAWLEWYRGWLRDVPEKGREAYMARTKAEYEGRTGETTGECLIRMREERFRKDLDERLAERIAERITKGRAERIAERTRSNVEAAINKQIMVGNFRIFRDEYMGMMGSRLC